jgi:2-methylcitrate dehydratase PrpD
MLIDKTATFKSAHDKPRMKDPVVLRHRAKVRLDPTAGNPTLAVTLEDGTRLTEDVKAVLGTVNNPMSREQVVAKCRGLGAGAKLIERTLDLENMKSVRELRALLQTAA